jgi:hypothetical protein
MASLLPSSVQEVPNKEQNQEVILSSENERYIRQTRKNTFFEKTHQETIIVEDDERSSKRARTEVLSSTPISLLYGFLTLHKE